MHESLCYLSSEQESIYFGIVRVNFPVFPGLARSESLSLINSLKIGIQGMFALGVYRANPFYLTLTSKFIVRFEFSLNLGFGLKVHVDH